MPVGRNENRYGKVTTRYCAKADGNGRPAEGRSGWPFLRSSASMIRNTTHLWRFSYSPAGRPLTRFGVSCVNGRGAGRYGLQARWRAILNSVRRDGGRYIRREMPRPAPLRRSAMRWRAVAPAATRGLRPARRHGRYVPLRARRTYARSSAGTGARPLRAALGRHGGAAATSAGSGRSGD